jgi:L-asparagine oxygenase
MSVKIIKNVDIGNIPPTPAIPIIDDARTPEATSNLIEIAGFHGYPVSYRQEQGGRLIQNIVPVHKNENQQISTSSKVELYLHTETAFHPYKPTHVILMCLRGDETALTTYSSLDDIVSELSEEQINVLRTPNFTTSLDDSFMMDGEPDFTLGITPLSRDKAGHDVFTFDWALMRGKTTEAKSTLSAVRDAISKTTKEVALKSGEVMVIDNRVAVHGRKPFQPKYDGSDRWVKRILTIDRLPPRKYMDEHVIDFDFEEEAM